MTARDAVGGVFSWTHRTRWDFPAPDSPTTGISRTPLGAARSRKSRRTSSSVTSTLRTSARPSGCRRRILSGAWVAKKTAGAGETASVLIVAPATVGDQQRYCWNSAIGGLQDLDVGD